MAPRPRPNPFVISPVELQKYKMLFKEYDDANIGFIQGDVAAEYLSQSALPPPILSQIWKLADVDKDGALNEYEFIVATHLTKLVQKMRIPVPKELPLPLLKENIGKEPSGMHPMDPNSKATEVEFDDSKMTIEQLRKEVIDSNELLMKQEVEIQEKVEQSQSLTLEAVELQRQLDYLNNLIASQDNYLKNLGVMESTIEKNIESIEKATDVEIDTTVP